MTRAFYDFGEDFALLSILEEFIDEMAIDLKNPANTLRALIKKKVCFHLFGFEIIIYYVSLEAIG